MTDDDLGFDLADTELARRLGSAAPPAGDADAVLAGLRPRLTRARRRRQSGFVAISAAVVVLFAGAAFAAVDAGDGAKVRVPPANQSPVTVDSVPAPTAPTVPTASADERATPTTPSATAPATPATSTPGSPPTTVDDHGANRGPGSSGSTSGSGSGSSGSGSSGSGSDSSGSGSSGSGGSSGTD